MIYFLYGPPGSGKTSLGRALSTVLGLEFVDLDDAIRARAGMEIHEIFAREGEPGFRAHERDCLVDLIKRERVIIALGGGALLDARNRADAERAGRVLCLYATPEVLASRLRAEGPVRPLLAVPLGGRCFGSPGQDAVPQVDLIDKLLKDRSDHYVSFPINLDTSALSLEETTWQAQVRLGTFRVTGMGDGYPAWVESGGIDRIGDVFKSLRLAEPVALVSDERVAAIYAHRAIISLESAGYTARLVTFPSGEGSKNLETVARLWQAFVDFSLERGGTVLALGGGVVGDLAGFAAATYLRGVSWALLPTSLLAMVDASLGGKTGFDLPQGKNLVGVFYPPSFVLVDPITLATLPEDEFRAGMAEVLKAGIIADSQLFDLCSSGSRTVRANLAEVIQRAMAVKVRIIQQDPYEADLRAVLNFGHTIGHALERASSFRLRHGEAVAMGMVAESRLSERIGLAESGLSGRIEKALFHLGLPTEIEPELMGPEFIQAIRLDKKRARRRVRFALPVRIGEVRPDVEVENYLELISRPDALTSH